MAMADIVAYFAALRMFLISKGCLAFRMNVAVSPLMSFSFSGPRCNRAGFRPARTSPTFCRKGSMRKWWNYQFCTPCGAHHPDSGTSSFSQFQGQRPLQEGTLPVLRWSCIGNTTFTSACVATGIFAPTSGFVDQFHVEVTLT